MSVSSHHSRPTDCEWRSAGFSNLHLTSAVVDPYLQTTSEHYFPRETERSSKHCIHKKFIRNPPRVASSGRSWGWAELDPLDGIQWPQQREEEDLRGARAAKQDAVTWCPPESERAQPS